MSTNNSEEVPVRTNSTDDIGRLSDGSQRLPEDQQLIKLSNFVIEARRP
jgi:hypothetical protein